MDVAVLFSDNFDGGPESETPEISPTPGKLYLVQVEIYDSDDNPPGISIEGWGLDWQDDVDGTFLDVELGEDAQGRLNLFWAVGTPSAGTLAISHPDSSVTYCGVNVIEVGGVNLSNPVRQANVNSGAGNAMSVTLAAFGSAQNATFGFFTNDEGQAVAPGSGFTEIVELLGFQCEWKPSNDTSVDATTTSSPEWAGIAIEVVPAEFTGTGSPNLPRLTASAAGTHQAAQTGIAAANMPRLTAEATGYLQPDGTGAPILPQLAASGAGYMQPDGTGTPTLPALTAAGTGAQTGEGEIAGGVIARLPTLAASGTGSAIAGTGAPMLPALTAAGTSVLVFEGTAAPRLQAFSAAGTGASVPLGGSFRVSYHRGIRPARRQFR